jgi:hypothetical protein
MKWTEPSPPMPPVSYEDHVVCETPIGVFKIEWRGWKEGDDYSVMLDGVMWIGCEPTLDDAKAIAKKYLVDKYHELGKMLGITAETIHK